jgi:Undecaprenyl-phosphate glucose phosphotransferase
MFKQNSNIFLSILVLIDLVFLAFAYLISRYIVFAGHFLNSFTFKEVLIVSVLIIIFFIMLEKFEISHSYRFRPINDIIKNIIFFELFIISLFYLLIIFDIYKFNDKVVFYFVIITFSSFFVERVFIKVFLNFIRKSGFNFKRYLVIGAGDLGINFYKKVKVVDELGIKIVGFLDDDPDLKNSSQKKYTGEIKRLILGETDDIEKILESKVIDNVVIALPMCAEEKIIQIINICEKNGVRAELIPDYYKIISSTPSLRQIEGYPLIGIRKIPLENMFNRLIKRILDLFFSILGLIVLSPVFIILIAVIYLTSGGPIFFKQRRTGYKKNDFYILKFRTMKVNNDSDKIQATKDDPRKTKVGSFLRKTNLDELPQLINILRGEMSIVGPRPHMIVHTEEFYKKYDKYHVRHWVKPGLTGWAQVNGWRGNSDIGMRIRYDIEYIEKWTVWFDIKIIFLTIFSKKVRKNAA